MKHREEEVAAETTVIAKRKRIFIEEPALDSKKTPGSIHARTEATDTSPPPGDSRRNKVEKAALLDSEEMEEEEVEAEASDDEPTEPTLQQKLTTVDVSNRKFASEEVNFSHYTAHMLADMKELKQGVPVQNLSKNSFLKISKLRLTKYSKGAHLQPNKLSAKMDRRCMQFYDLYMNGKDEEDLQLA